MSQEALRRIHATKEDNLNYLDLSGLGLEAIPDEITSLTWIGALSLSRNRIKDISLLAKLPNLHKLALSDNCIDDITVLNDLPKLRFIFLGNNQIEELSVIKSQKRLKKLVVNDNNLRSLPDLSHFVLMVYLDISNNPLVPPDTTTIKEMLPNIKIYKT